MVREEFKSFTTSLIIGAFVDQKQELVDGLFDSIKRDWVADIALITMIIGHELPVEPNTEIYNYGKDELDEISNSYESDPRVVANPDNKRPIDKAISFSRHGSPSSISDLKEWVEDGLFEYAGCEWVLSEDDEVRLVEIGERRGIGVELQNLAYQLRKQGNNYNVRPIVLGISEMSKEVLGKDIFGGIPPNGIGSSDTYSLCTDNGRTHAEYGHALSKLKGIAKI